MCGVPSPVAHPACPNLFHEGTRHRSGNRCRRPFTEPAGVILSVDNTEGSETAGAGMRSPARHLGSDAEKLTSELTATITQQR